MRPVVVSVEGWRGGPAGNGTSLVVPVDYHRHPFAMSIATSIRGRAIYRVEHTYDDVFSPGFSSAKARWFRAPDRSLAFSWRPGQGKYTMPPTGVRLVVLAGSGTVSMSVIHGGLPVERPLGLRRTAEAPPARLTVWQRVRRWIEALRP